MPRLMSCGRGSRLAGAAAAIGLILAWPSAAPAQQGKQAVPVEVAEVETATVRDEVAAVGTLLSNESVVIRPEIAGRITGIHFEEGQPVEAGAPLFSLDDSLYRAEQQEAQAALDLSERNFRRAKELFERGAGSARARDEALSELQRDRALLALVDARLEKTRIIAPFDGILGLRRVSSGAYVTPGLDLVVLEMIDPLKVDFRIPERYLALVHEGQSIEVAVDAFPGERFEGEVFALAPRIDREGRSLELRARIDNSDRRLRPGLFARVSLVTAARPNAILVPEQAIMPRADGRFVYRLEDGKAQLVKVELGRRQAGKVEILEGLGPNDRVVIAGQLKLRDGVPVNPVGVAGGS